MKFQFQNQNSRFISTMKTNLSLFEGYLKNKKNEKSFFYIFFYFVGDLLKRYFLTRIKG